MPFGSRSMRDRVVEVAGVLAVDGDGRERAEVGPAARGPLAHRAAEPPRLRDRLVAVLVGDAVLADDDLGVDAGLVDVAEHFDDAAERAARGVGQRVISTTTMSPGLRVRPARRAGSGRP